MRHELERMGIDRRGFLAASALALAPTAALAAREDDGAMQRPWPAGRATPVLELPAWSGKPYRLAEARGRVVLLNFWASWCAPCRAEMPSLELLAARVEPLRVDVLAVNYRETDGAIRRFLEQTGFSLPILRDRDGSAARAFEVRIFPTTVAIGRDGRAVYSVVGEADWTRPQAREWLAPLL